MADEKLEDFPLLIRYPFLNHLDKVFWKEDKIRKGDLLTYYAQIAPYILPYVKNRPQVLRRFPEGFQGISFFQKNLVSHPPWVSTVAVQHHGKIVHYLLIKDRASLLFAVNLGCIEIHSWLSTYQRSNYPSFSVLDLDPEDISFESVIETARVIYRLLKKKGIESFCKTSGSRGLHILIPLRAKYSYEESKSLAYQIALETHALIPSFTSLERSPKKRQKKVYIDFLQNNFGQSLVVPFSVRAKPGAPVSTPLKWSEVKTGLSPSQFNLFNTLERIKGKKDFFQKVLK
jgi:bifunctional non-homologous end joining protein LigD